VFSRKDLEAEKQEARKQRLESAKIASAPATGFPQLPVFSPPKKVRVEFLLIVSNIIYLNQPESL